MLKLGVTLDYAFYLASIVIGAGVLQMVLLAWLVGLLPFLAATMLIGLIFGGIYHRIGNTIYYDNREEIDLLLNEARPVTARALIAIDSTWERHMRSRLAVIVAEQGAAVFDRLVEKTVGPPGLWALLVGMFFYVWFADITYVSIGTESIAKLAEYLSKGPVFGVAGVALAGLVAIGSALTVPGRLMAPTVARGAVEKFLMMGGWWLLGMALSSLIPEGTMGLGMATLRSQMAAVFFVLAILFSMRTGYDSPQASGDSVGLIPIHRVAVVITKLRLVLLFIAGVATLVLFAATGELVNPAPYLLPVDGLGLGQLPSWSQVIGVVIFAFVGTGIFNICRYSQLVDDSSGKNSFGDVVKWGSIIAIAAYLWWTIVAALTLSADDASFAVQQGWASHIAIGEKARAANEVAAWFIFVAGYSFALMAVTSACVGFTESLADRLERSVCRVVEGRRDGSKNTTSGLPLEPHWRAPVDLRFPILVSAGLAALAKDAAGLPIDNSGILALAGYAGGGLLLLVLPWFFFRQSAGHGSRKEHLAGLATGVGLVILLVTTPIGTEGVVGLIALTVKWVCVGAVGFITAWLYQSASSRSAGRRREELESPAGV